MGTKMTHSVSFQSVELRDKTPNKFFAANEMQRGIDTSVEFEPENLLSNPSMLKNIFRTEVLRQSTVDSIDFVSFPKFHNTDAQDLIAQKTNDCLEALDTYYNMGQNKDVYDETASISIRCRNRTLSSTEDWLTEEKRKPAMEEGVDTRQHDLSQPAMKTDLHLEKAQAKWKEKASLSKQKVSPSSRCDQENSRVINCISLEDFHRRDDVIVETLPRHLKRTIKYNEKVLQFFENRIRNRKKKTKSKVSGYFAKQRCSEESNDMQGHLGHEKQCMAFDVGCVKEVRTHNERTVSSKLTKANLTEVETMRLSSNSINAPESLFTNNAKDNDKTLVSKCINYKETEVPRVHEIINEQKEEESKAKDGSETPTSECVRKDFYESNVTVLSDIVLQTTQDVKGPQRYDEQSRKCWDGLELKGNFGQWGMQVLRKEFASEDLKKAKNNSNYDKIGIIKKFALSSTENLDRTNKARGSNIDWQTDNHKVNESVRVASLKRK